MVDLTIGRIAATDVDVLSLCAALSVKCFPVTPGQQWQAAALSRHLTENDNALFAGFEGKALAVFALFSLLEGEGELLSICVAPAHRRKGHARSMLLHALKVMDPLSVTLEVAASNEPAIRLYQGLGFNEIGRRKGYYRLRRGEAVDAIVMGLSHPE